MAPSPFPPELGPEGFTATYFQHKVAAEGHSVVDLVGEKLVEPFDPPYKKGSGKKRIAGKRIVSYSLASFLAR